jgi:hypothetical protein
MSQFFTFSSHIEIDCSSSVSVETMEIFPRFVYTLKPNIYIFNQKLNANNLLCIIYTINVTSHVEKKS